MKLPQSISPTPITLHTLFSSWSGMQFGSFVGSSGAAIHAISWFMIHTKRRINFDHREKKKARKWMHKFSLEYLRRSQAGVVHVPLGMGYILGLIPCAALSGILVKCDTETIQIFKMHPIAASAMGQTTTLLVGTLWIHLFQHCEKDSQKSNKIQWKTNFVPFIPGLLVKSLLSWALLEQLSE